MVRIPFLLLCSVLLALVGCGGGDDDGSSSASSPAQQVAVASESLGMLLDASTEATLSLTTAEAAARAARPGDAPDLAALTRAVHGVDLATLKVNGQRLFRSGTATGTITVTTTGTTADSWPVGTTTLFTGSVTVAIVDVRITNDNGDSLSIPTGTFSYTLDAESTKTDDHNWTITIDADAAVDPSFAATLTHDGGTYSVSLGGHRLMHQVITRVQVDGGADTRTSEITVSGNVPGSTLTSDPVRAARTYTDWTIAYGGRSVTWNRHAAVTTVWDYTKLGTAGAFTVSAAHDDTFISTTVNDHTTLLGPFTAAQAGAVLRAKFHAQWL